jgi:hypothetical protein
MTALGFQQAIHHLILSHHPSVIERTGRSTDQANTPIPQEVASEERMMALVPHRIRQVHTT